MANKSEASGCLGLFFRLIGLGRLFRGASNKGKFPYQLRDNFLSPAELSFYRVLEQSVGTSYSINNKVRLWDVLYVPRRDDSRSYENKISSKHIDFLLCDPSTMQPKLAIELDDASHDLSDRRDRDNFVDQAFAAAGLPILHIKAARTYSITELTRQLAAAMPGNRSAPVKSPPLLPISTEPSCPKCHIPMVQRKSAKGTHAGKRFWACTNYPQCREIIGID